MLRIGTRTAMSRLGTFQVTNRHSTTSSRTTENKGDTAKLVNSEKMKGAAFLGISIIGLSLVHQHNMKSSTPNNTDLIF